MAKYSVNSNQSTERSEQERARGGSCELCGEETDYLHSAEFEGALLEVCADCVPEDETHDDHPQSTSDESTTQETTKKDLINQTTPTGDEANPDSAWAEQGVGYSDDPLPYLVDDYGDVVRNAREDKDLTQEELAESINVGVNIIRVIEQNQASDRDVGGTIIEQLESQLDIEIEEDV